MFIYGGQGSLVSRNAMRTKMAASDPCDISGCWGGSVGYVDLSGGE